MKPFVETLHKIFELLGYTEGDYDDLMLLFQTSFMGWLSDDSENLDLFNRLQTEIENAESPDQALNLLEESLQGGDLLIHLESKMSEYIKLFVDSFIEKLAPENREEINKILLQLDESNESR